MTLKHLTLEDANCGLWVHDQSIRFTGEYLTVADNSGDGMTVESDSSQSSFDSLTAYDNGGDGIDISTAIASLSNSQAYDNGGDGIYLINQGPVLVENDVAYGNQTGIHVYNSSGGTPAIIGDPNLSYDPSVVSSGNIVYDNVYVGIYAGGNVVAAGNTVYRQTRNGAIGIQVNYGAVAQENVVYDNYYGIGDFSAGGQAIENRVYDNGQAGIYVQGFGAVLQDNTVYSNGIGVQLSGGGDLQLSNNLIYANVNQGILCSGVTNYDGNLAFPCGAQIVNNTIYQPAGDGDAIEIQNNCSDISLENNILWVQAVDSYDVVVSSDSQNGFDSDYNDLVTSGGGQVALWQGIARPTLSAWQNTAFTDQNSLSLDPLFVNVPPGANAVGYRDVTHDGRGDDFHLQSLYGSFHGGSFAPAVSAATGLPFLLTGTWTDDAAQSPGIDRGDAASSFSNEPSPNGGYVNLGSDGDTDHASKSPASYVLVTTPNGGEVWPVAQTFPIGWRSQDSAGTVTIQLWQQGNPTPVLTIASGVADSGQYLWTIPDTIAPASNYVIQVSRDDLPGIVGQSAAPFTIGAPVTVFYVNDGTVLPGDWTTAPGNNANDGFTPATPKASIQAVLAAYNLAPGDVILVDDGTYDLGTTILLTAVDLGITIEGYNDASYPGRSAVLDRGNTNYGQYVFELAGAQDVTLEDLTITGGYEGIYAGGGEGSTGLTVSNCTIYGNGYMGVDLESSNDHPTLSNDTVYGQSYGLFLNAVNDALLSGNTVHDNSSEGIHIYGLRDVADANNAYANGTGMDLYVYGGTTADQSQESDNTVHDNIYVGIYAGGNAVAAGNTVYRQTRNGAIGIQVNYGAVAQENVVYDNYYGIGDFSVGGQAIENRVYDNSQAGIYVQLFGAVLQGNTVYGNGIGVQLSGAGDLQLSNNLIYANVNQGILCSGVTNYDGNLAFPCGAQITNNTIYQPVGDAIRIQGNSSDISLENNILWVQAGYDLYVTADSEQGFSSDYNDLYTTATGKLASWEGHDFTTLADWVYEVGQDKHSVNADPEFIQPAGLDGIPGFSTLPDTSVPAQIIDNDSASGFSSNSDWTLVTGSGYNDDYLQSTTASDVATYTFSVAPGWYQVRRHLAGHRRRLCHQLHDLRRQSDCHAPGGPASGAGRLRRLRGFLEGPGRLLHCRQHAHGAGLGGRLVAVPRDRRCRGDPAAAWGLWRGRRLPRREHFADDRRG